MLQLLHVIEGTPGGGFRYQQKNLIFWCIWFWMDAIFPVMKSNVNKEAFVLPRWISAVLGLVTIVFSLIMLLVFPSSAELSDGFKTPVIAFEFARTEADISFLAGDDEVSRSNREKMDAGHQWDMLFPFAYVSFIISMLVQLGFRGHRFTLMAIPIAVLIVPFDIYENVNLMAITDALRHSESPEIPLQALHMATWLKWGALGVSMAALAIGFLTAREYLSATISLLGALSIWACWASNATPVVAETMSAVVSIFFLYFVVRACVDAWKAPNVTNG